MIIKSLSPDGQKNITITDDGDHEVGDAYEANVRDLKTKKSLFKFSWMNSPRMEGRPDENACVVSWRPNSRAFTTEQEVAYGATGCEVFARLDDGKFHEIELFSFVALIDKKYGLSSKGKGYYRVVKWLPHNRFIVEVSDQHYANEYWVTLRLPIHTNSTRPKAILESIRPAS